MTDYDSELDTRRHIARVRDLLLEVSMQLHRRIQEHDQTKLEAPEKPVYDEYTPKLGDAEYGSEEYEQLLEEMQEALEHHYSDYRHHPEHFEGGI